MTKEKRERRLRAIAADATTIGDLYSLTGEHPLIALLDPKSRTIYAATRASERVKAKLLIKEVRGNTWVSFHPDLKGEYDFAPIERLNLTHLLRAGMAAVNEKSKCDKSAKGECCNFYDADDKFSYSWKPTEDIFMCEWSATQDCTDIMKTVSISAYPEKNCKGTPVKRDQLISFCSPF